MPDTPRNYTISTDFPGGVVNTTNLKAAILASSITTVLNRIDTAADAIAIVFNAALTAGEATTLDNDTTGPAGGLIALHNNSQNTMSDAVSAESFTKASHGLVVGDVVRHAGPNPEDFVKAQADTGDNAEAIGVIATVVEDDFTVGYGGRISGLSGLTAGSTHFLDASTAGALTTTPPTISKPVLFATSTTSGVVLLMRGMSDTADAQIYRIPHTWAISGEIKVPSGDTDFIMPFFVSLAPGQTAKLVKVRYRINSGNSVTAKLQQNDGDITGFTGLSVTTTATTTDPADVTLADDDKLALIVTAVSGTPLNMTFTIFIEVTR